MAAVSTCCLCGREFTGRGEHGRSTHYNCRLSVGHSMNALARNLATAGALCASYWQGCRAVGAAMRGCHWEPGCGKEAL